MLYESKRAFLMPPLTVSQVANGYAIVGDETFDSPIMPL
jgi:hypothetical protein